MLGISWRFQSSHMVELRVNAGPSESKTHTLKIGPSYNVICRTVMSSNEQSWQMCLYVIRGRVCVDVFFKPQHSVLGIAFFILKSIVVCGEREALLGLKSTFVFRRFPSHPIQVHRMIAEFKLIPGLNNLFDKLIWRKHSASALVLHGHNQNCDCSPVSEGPGAHETWVASSYFKSCCWSSDPLFSGSRAETKSHILWSH